MAALSDFGYAGLFLWVFLEQIGLPIPAIPVLVAAGAFVSSGRLALLPCLLLVLVASLAADFVWYYLGRVRGHTILNLLCRLSWKPDSCIGTTTNIFTKHGARTLLFAKFIPGLSTIAPPLAGVVKISPGRFALYDGAGALVWGLLPLLAGMGLKDMLPHLLFLLRHDWPWLIVAATGAWALWNYLRRRAFVQELEQGLAQGIEADDLKAMIDRGETLALLDVRPAMDRWLRPDGLPGALPISYSEFQARRAELPLDRILVPYCDCPRDEGSVGAAKILREMGAATARPLLGGLKGWKAKGYPVTALNAAKP